MGRQDVEQLVLGVRSFSKSNGEPLSERTVLDHMTAIKTFWRWLKGTDDETPPEVKWIRTNPTKRSSKLPDELPNPDDIQQLISATHNARDKALISVLFDSGCRIGEILTLRMKNIQFDDYGGVLLVTGKTGQRRVRIIQSVQRLQTWLDQHPFRNDPEAAVFCSISNKSMGTQLKYEAVSRLLKNLKRRAGVVKKVNPHAFRHARATLLAQHLTDSQLKQYFGWQADSKMASVYIHLSGKELDPTLANLAGLATEQVSNGVRKMKICERCRVANAPESTRCAQCFSPFITTEQDEKKKIAEIVFNILRQFGVQVDEKHMTLL
jgi:integrase/ribosomal protein L40E